MNYIENNLITRVKIIRNNDSFMEKTRKIKMNKKIALFFENLKVLLFYFILVKAVVWVLYLCTINPNFYSYRH